MRHADAHARAHTHTYAHAQVSLVIYCLPVKRSVCWAAAKLDVIKCNWCSVWGELEKRVMERRVGGRKIGGRKEGGTVDIARLGGEIETGMKHRKKQGVGEKQSCCR